MNNKKLKSIITDEIVERLTQVIEEMSTNEFVDMICDKYTKETGEDLEDEVSEDTDTREIVRDMIGDKVFPLYGKMSEYIVETHLK